MSLSTKVGGVWKDVSNVHTKVSGSWKQVSEVWTKVSGVWKLVWQYFSAALDDTSYFGSNGVISPGVPVSALAPVQCIVTGGQAPYTYLWTLTGGYDNLFNSTTANPTIRILSSTDRTESGTIYCTVTDALSNVTNTPTATWELEISG